MSAVKEFEGYARECIRLATQADNEVVRKDLFEIARAWMHAAMEEENMADVTQSLPFGSRRIRP